MSSLVLHVKFYLQKIHFQSGMEISLHIDTYSRFASICVRLNHCSACPENVDIILQKLFKPILRNVNTTVNQIFCDLIWYMLQEDVCYYKLRNWNSIWLQRYDTKQYMKITFPYIAHFYFVLLYSIESWRFLHQKRISGRFRISIFIPPIAKTTSRRSIFNKWISRVCNSSLTLTIQASVLSVTGL